MIKINIQKALHGSSGDMMLDIKLSVKQGEFIALMGESGSGKTTLLRVLAGLEKAEGEISVEDILWLGDKKKLPPQQREIGFVFQNYALFDNMTVEENLLIAAEALNLPEETVHPRIEKLLEIFNIEPIRAREGIRLSGGERRRVEIARALVGEPKFLLLDEPFAGVDPIAVIDIQNIIKQLVDLDMGILITDHNVRETLGICDRAYVMRSGEMLATGTSDEIANDENVKKYYLGEHFTF